MGKVLTQMKWNDVQHKLPRREAMAHWVRHREALTVVVCRTEPPILLPCACTFDPVDQIFVDYDGKELRPTHWMLLPYMPGDPCFFLCGATGKACMGCVPGACPSRRRV